MMLPANFNIEEDLWRAGVDLVAGADEVGRGAWAGPVVAAAVIFPKNIDFPEELFDSKKISSSRREQLAKLIYTSAKTIGIGTVGVSYINKFGIGKATHKAFRSALKNLLIIPERILVDAFYIKHLNKEQQKPVKKGDEICASIAAASIVAKVCRDSFMIKLSKKYPAYLFENNKGYGTSYHQNAIRKYNFSSTHRTSFNLSYLTQ